MKKTERILSVFLVLALVCLLCACGEKSSDSASDENAVNTMSASEDIKSESVAEMGKTDSATVTDSSGTGESAETAPTRKLPVDGDYTIFGILNEGYLVDAGELGLVSSLTLSKDGRGTMNLNDDSMAISSWKVDGDTVTIVMEDESTAEADVKNGVLELDLYGNESMILYYAQEGADLSAYSVMTKEEYQEAASAVPDSLLYEYWSGLDPTVIHLNYDMHTDYMDADQSFDVHVRDGMYYSERRTLVSDYEDINVTYSADGKVYNLDPEKKTGSAVTTVTSLAEENLAQMDHLYAEIWSHARLTEFKEETREKDGVSCTVLVYPETEYLPESSFYFEGDGKLVYYVQAAPVVETAVDIGETSYTIHVIDEKVDEELLDISEYEISE